MEWHINDLSLSGQFADSEAFRLALTPILQLRAKRDLLRSRFFCSRTLVTRLVLGGHPNPANGGHLKTGQ
jgi:hypothetical protein